MVIIELYANMVLVDADDNLVAQIGTNGAVCEVEGWPNVKNERDETVRNNLLEAGKLNSPHGRSKWTPPATSTYQSGSSAAGTPS